MEKGVPVSQVEIFNTRSGKLFRNSGGFQTESISPKSGKTANKQDWRVIQTKSHAMRTVATEDPQGAIHYQVHLKGSPCFDIVSSSQVTDRHQSELDAIATYYQAVSGLYQKETPGESECIRRIRKSDVLLQFSYGFPLRYWNIGGDSRFLVSVKYDVKLDPELFLADR